MQRTTVDAIMVICLLGWIPIYALLSGIASIVKAYKETSCDCICDDCKNYKDNNGKEGKV